MGRSKSVKKKSSKFANLSLFFFDRPKLTLVLWAELIIVGILSFTFFLPREGFPPIQFPIGVASGTYFVDDAEKVDQDITKKIAEAVSGKSEITQLDTVAGDNFFSVVASYADGQTSESGNEILEQAIEDAGIMPQQSTIDFTVINPGQFLNQYDALVSVYAKDGQTPEQLEEVSRLVAEKVSNYDGVELSEVVTQFDTGVNPFTQQEETIQSSFAGIAQKNIESLDVKRSSTIGVTKTDDIDIVELSESINKAVDEINADPKFADVGIVVGADFAEVITTQIDSLAENLLTAVLVVAAVCLILIGWRVSIITSLIIVTVLLATLFIMFLIGFTLNTITLFGLVLALGLFVDDATIISEALDANKKKSKKARELVKETMTKIGSASFAGSMTTILMFMPLVFVSGILGEFIRILPLTVIIALISSLILSLTLIPFMSKYLIFSPKNLNAKPKKTFINKAEARAGMAMSNFVGLTKKSRTWAYGLSVTMVMVSIVFVLLGGAIGSKVKFNIFPPNKDSDQLSVSLNFIPGTTIDGAEAVSDEVAVITKNSIGGFVERMSIGAQNTANARSADILVDLTPFSMRDVKSPEIIEQLNQALEGYDKAQVRVTQIDSGPPTDQFPFKVQVYGEDPEQTAQKAEEIQEFLSSYSATRPNGTTSDITGTKISYVEDVARRQADRFVQVEASYADTDTTALVVATQQAVEDNFDTSNLKFDFGFESDSQDSFSSLPVVGLIALTIMFVLLAFQFRSLIQPLLIFLAIPFSFFGVMLGLYITNNPISFFVMIGIFGLIGLSVNNTILITDYANQERRAGKRVIDSVASAIQQRFRPLVVTTTTTVVALLPLALSDPFWESLAFTIIFGLISSTLFVIISFPFYYILIEGLRVKVKDIFRSKRGVSG
jgi:multidrug efflux pump subunit AcrB